MNEALMSNFDKMFVKDSVSVIHSSPNKTPYVVATVAVEKNFTDLEKCEKAFMLTNSISDAWWNNKEVSAMFTSSGCRSTSVGDYVLVGDTKYLCADFGWEKIPK